MTVEPGDVLDSVLDWLQTQIDLEHLAKVEQHHRDVMHWRPFALGLS